MRARTCILLALGCGLFAGPLPAVVVRPGSAQEATRPPPDDPGFAFVGRIETLTAVYLGGGWVLAAAHVVGSDPVFRLGESDYPALEGSWVQLETEPGQLADLGLFRLQTEPRRGRLSIAREPPRPDEPVVLVGNGWSAGREEIHWSVDWEEVPPARGIYSGLKRAGPGVMRWGQNRITWTERETPLDEWRTRTFQARFDRTGGPEAESAVTRGDSGGAVFAKREEGWELLGILVAATRFSGQPGNVVAFGNAAVAADLSHYREQIQRIVAPPGAYVVWLGAALAALLLVLGGWLLSRRIPASRVDPRG